MDAVRTIVVTRLVLVDELCFWNCEVWTVTGSTKNNDINLLLNSNDDAKKGCFILIRLEAITIIDNI